MNDDCIIYRAGGFPNRASVIRCLIFVAICAGAISSVAFIGGGGSGGTASFATAAYHADNIDNAGGTNVDINGHYTGPYFDSQDAIGICNFGMGIKSSAGYWSIDQLGSGQFAQGLISWTKFGDMTIGVPGFSVGSLTVTNFHPQGPCIFSNNIAGLIDVGQVRGLGTLATANGVMSNGISGQISDSQIYRAYATVNSTLTNLSITLNGGRFVYQMTNTAALTTIIPTAASPFATLVISNGTATPTNFFINAAGTPQKYSTNVLTVPAGKEVYLWIDAPPGQTNYFN